MLVGVLTTVFVCGVISRCYLLFIFGVCNPFDVLMIYTLAWYNLVAAVVNVMLYVRCSVCLSPADWTPGSFLVLICLFTKLKLFFSNMPNLFFVLLVFEIEKDFRHFVGCWFLSCTVNLPPVTVSKEKEQTVILRDHVAMATQELSYMLHVLLLLPTVSQSVSRSISRSISQSVGPICLHVERRKVLKSCCMFNSRASYYNFKIVLNLYVLLKSK